MPIKQWKNVVGTKPIKGNSKGSLRSYQARRTLIFVGLTLLMIWSCLIYFSFVETTEDTKTNYHQVSAVMVVANKNHAKHGNDMQETEVLVDGQTRTRTVSVTDGLKGSGSSNIDDSQDEEEAPEYLGDDADPIYNDDKDRLELEERMNQEIQGDDDEDLPEEDSGLPPTYPLDHFPTLKYGTAWKEDRTADLVRKAIHAGFRHIDTACQPKHYNEAGVGEGWTAAAADLGLQRKDIWLQTKFTNLDGQDPERLPYDKDADLETQVRQSVQKSLENLKTDYIDSLVMHGPEKSWDGTLLVWAVFESFVDQGVVKQIGVSNAWNADFVKYLYEKARIKPACVQQRFHAQTAFEVEMRDFCKEKGMEFQSFWTLGANLRSLQNDEVQDLADSKGLSLETLLYAFCLAIGITPLDGTTNEQHMEEDIELLNRIKKSGERIFNDGTELTIVASALGIPDWTVPAYF